MTSPPDALIPAQNWRRIKALLTSIYGETRGRETAARARELLERFGAEHRWLRTADHGARLSERDVILISYGDQIREPGVPPLRALERFLTERVAGIINGLHILPFFPYSSDDGFSVRDFDRVDPALGGWADIRRIATRFRLMADAVVNHASAQGEWFRRFLEDDPRYRDFFIVTDPTLDLSATVRPRALPLLTAFEGARGNEYLWTTFSADQIDLNYANPDVLLEMTRVLLDYVANGAELIRLDAIAYLWKEPGTTSIHLRQTHDVVRFWRAVLDVVAPRTLLITETNVPHEENISYFGDGHDEAQLVYNFPLPPLVLHTLQSGDSTALQRWAAALETPGGESTFFNFLASHDGIGVRPLEGLLQPAAIDALVERVHAHGGRVSYRDRADGGRTPYELNINYFDALNDPASDEPPARQVARFLVAHSILLTLAGMPGIYIHSLLGSRGWPEGVERLGHNRAINREKLDRDRLDQELDEVGSRRRQIFTRMLEMIRARIAEPACHPNAPQRVIATDPALFVLRREAMGGGSGLLCIHNVTAEPQPLTLGADEIGLRGPLRDLLGGDQPEFSGDRLTLDVPAYGLLWLREARR